MCYDGEACMKCNLFCLLFIAVIYTAAFASESGSPFDGPPAAERGRLDSILFTKWKAAGIPVSSIRLCSDAVFVRRAFLDVTGRLPAAGEVSAFLKDQAADKRERLIDRLLQRDEFADYWAMKWCEILRVKSEYPINLWPNAAQCYHRWIRTALRENTPYDRFARELLTASGSNFRVPQVNFYRAIQGRGPAVLTRAVALTFMGDRMESWPKDRCLGSEAFFSRVGYKSTQEWKEEIVFFDLSKPLPKNAVLPDGSRVALRPEQDPRQVFADWLLRRENPWFARNAVNRTWFWLLGRGILEPPDNISCIKGRQGENQPDIRDARTAKIDDALLDLLQSTLIASHWDLKAVFRMILNSCAYQASCVQPPGCPGAADQFAAYRIRRLEAEVLVDALNDISGMSEEYSSPVPEPFTWIPEGTRAVTLADGSITSPFLDLFGRPARDTGLLSERTNAVTAAQALHMLNSTHVRRKIEQGPKIRQLLNNQGKDHRRILSELYLTVLSRPPSEEEVRQVREYVAAQRGVKGAAPRMDVIWALISSSEFLYRH